MRVVMDSQGKREIVALITFSSDNGQHADQRSYD
jgi:hypothetical protein